MLKYLTGRTVADVEVVEWMSSVKKRLGELESRIDEIKRAVFTSNLYETYFRPLKFSCNGTTHSVMVGMMLGGEYVEYLINKVCSSIMCKHLDSYALQFMLYETGTRETIKDFLMTLYIERPRGKKKIAAISLDVKEYTYMHIYIDLFNKSVTLCLPYQVFGRAEPLGTLTPAVGMKWRDFAEEVERKYIDRFGRDKAILKNVPQVLMGMAELIDKYVDGLVDIARNYNICIGLALLYP